MNSGNNSNIMRNDNDVQKAIIEKIMFDEKDSKNKNKSKNLGKDKNFDDFSLKIKEMSKDLLESNKSITTFIKNIFKINDNILNVNDSSKELIEYINKLEKSFSNLSKVYIKFFEKIDLFNESLSNITISITNVNKETKPFINNIDKMGISIEKTSSSAKDSIDILVNLSNSLDQLTKKMNNQKNSIDNISVSIENYDTLLKSSNKINSDNIFKLDDKMTKYNKSIKNEINNLFDNHVIKYFTDKLHETGNVWRNRIKDLFYGISNRINSLYEDIKKNELMNINSNNIIKNSSPAISSVNLPPPLPIKRETSVGETIKNLPSLNNIVPSSVNASDNSIVYYLKNIQESMNENYKKIIKKIGKDEDLNETLNKSKPLMEQLVMKKTPEGVSINWLYKQLFTNGIKVKGGSGGIGGGGFLSGPRSLLSNLWNGLTEPIVAGALIFRDEIKRAVSSIFSLPKKMIDGSNFLLHNSIFRFTAGLTGVGFAINDAYEGWKSAAEWFKKPQNELNMEEKAIAAFSGLVGGTEKGLKNALGQGAKWAAIGNMFAPGIGAIIGGAIGLVSGYVGGEAIANFLKNMWDGAKVAFSNFADWVSEVWNTKYEDDKTVRDRMINNGKIIEKIESEALKEEDKLFNIFSARLENFRKRRIELLNELDNLLSGIVKLNKQHFEDMNVLTDQYLHPVEPRKFVDLQDRYLNNKNMRNDQLLRQEELQDKRDTLRSLTLSKQVPIEKKSLEPQSHGKISNANEMYHEYLKKKKQEELQDERDFQRENVLFKKQEVHYNEYMKSIKQNDSNFGNINPDQVIQEAHKIIEGAGVSPFYEQLQEIVKNAQSNETIEQTSDKISEEMKEYNKKLQEAIESGQAFKPVSIAELKDVEKMGKKAITPGSIYTHDIHVEKNMSNLFKNLLGFLEINFINLLESKIFKNKTKNKVENESSTISNVAKSIFNIIKNINNTNKTIISKITDVFLNNFKLLLNIQDENSKDFAYLGDMGKKSTTPGSIYTHDIHLEGFFSKFLKNIDRMIINQEELNKLIKEFKSMEESEIETETKGYVTTTKKSSESSTPVPFLPPKDQKTPSTPVPFLPKDQKTTTTRPLDMTTKEREVARMTAKEQIYSDTSLPDSYKKKLDNNLKIHGNANVEGLTPEMKARLANAAEEYKKVTGKNFGLTSGYRSGEKQADIMMEKWNQGIGKQWYGSTFNKLGLAKNGKLLVSEEEAKKKLAEHYNTNKIGHTSGNKIDVSKDDLKLKTEILKKYGIKSTNIKNDEIDFILDEKFNNVLSKDSAKTSISPESAKKEQIDSMKKSSETSVSSSDALKEMVKRHEGKRDKAYKDTEGHWTIGYGHKLGDDPSYKDTQWSEEKINEVFNKDLSKAQSDASKIPEFANLNNARQNALTDMTFNMGKGGVMKFEKMRAALANGDFETASKEILDSKYAKQTGNRAKEIAEIIRSGKMEGVIEGKENDNKSMQIADIERKKTEDLQAESAKQIATATSEAGKSSSSKDTKTEDKSDSIKGQASTAFPQNIDPIPARILAYNFEIEGFSGIFKG